MDAWDLNPTPCASDSLACGAIAIDPADPTASTSAPARGRLHLRGAVVGAAPTSASARSAATTAATTGLHGADGTGLAHAGRPAPSTGWRSTPAIASGSSARRRRGSTGASRPALAYHWARKRTGIFTSVVAARTGGATTFLRRPVRRRRRPLDRRATWPIPSAPASRPPTSDASGWRSSPTTRTLSTRWSTAGLSDSPHPGRLAAGSDSDATWRQVTGPPDRPLRPVRPRVRAGTTSPSPSIRTTSTGSTWAARTGLSSSLPPPTPIAAPDRSTAARDQQWLRRRR